MYSLAHSPGTITHKTTVRMKKILKELWSSNHCKECQQPPRQTFVSVSRWLHVILTAVMADIRLPIANFVHTIRSTQPQLYPNSPSNAFRARIHKHFSITCATKVIQTYDISKLTANSCFEKQTLDGYLSQTHYTDRWRIFKLSISLLFSLKWKGSMGIQKMEQSLILFRVGEASIVDKARKSSRLS